MKAELFNLVLLGQYLVVPLVEPLGIWDLWVLCSTIYLFVYFKRKISRSFFLFTILARELLCSVEQDARESLCYKSSWKTPVLSDPVTSPDLAGWELVDRSGSACICISIDVNFSI